MFYLHLKQALHYIKMNGKIFANIQYEFLFIYSDII